MVLDFLLNFFISPYKPNDRAFKMPETSKIHQAATDMSVDQRLNYKKGNNYCLKTISIIL